MPGPDQTECLDEKYVSDEAMKAVKRNDSFQKFGRERERKLGLYLKEE